MPNKPRLHRPSTRHRAAEIIRRDPLATAEPARDRFRRLSAAALKSLPDRTLNLLSVHMEIFLQLAQLNLTCDSARELDRAIAQKIAHAADEHS